MPPVAEPIGDDEMIYDSDDPGYEDAVDDAFDRLRENADDHDHYFPRSYETGEYLPCKCGLNAEDAEDD